MISIPLVAVAAALAAAGFHLALLWQRRGAALEMGSLAILAPFAVVIVAGPPTDPVGVGLLIGLVVAILARNREDLLHSECALKLLWVMGTALALSWAGLLLLTVVTGTSSTAEQWEVLGIGLDPRLMWGTALSLALMIGVVLLATAPFHFWAADLFQGAAPWFGPLAVAALQATGAGWIRARLADVDRFAAAAQVEGDLLGIAALAAFIVGGATLVAQRRPERRVGTLASLNGGLVLAWLAVAPSGAGVSAAFDRRWIAHLLIALTGAGTLARFVPAAVRRPGVPPVLFRRHPWSGAIGLLSLASLAGVPGTPGSWLWLETARAVLQTGRIGLFLALAAAWVTAFATVTGEVRMALGVATSIEPPSSPVPWQARAALWAAGLGVAGVGLIGLVRG